MVKVKVCGLMREAEVAMANELRPDYVGFVLAPKSRYFIAPEHAGLLRSKLRREIETVGVFVNEPLDAVALCVDVAGLDAVQLHGNESEEYICALREYIPCPIIKTFRVARQNEVDRAARSSADLILLDSSLGEKPFDWSILSALRRPYFLAGGLSPENVDTALEIFPAPYALDVNSGVEFNRTKDYRRMMKFIVAAREHRAHSLAQEMRRRGL